MQKIFKKLKNNPELEIVIIFGKNERETKKSLSPENLELFKEFSYITIIYCSNLHAKYYANENEALLTSLNLLGKSMTGNIEYGICFQNEESKSEKLYEDSLNYTKELLSKNPCIYVKRPVYIETGKDNSKKHIESKVIYDVTYLLYNNSSYEKKYYQEFEVELLETDEKPTRENFTQENRFLQNPKSSYLNNIKKRIEVIKEDVEIVEIDKNIFPLTNNDLEKIQQDFQKRFSKIKINSTNTYIFCNELFPFADLMFREGFELRFNNSARNINQVINIIEGLIFETTHFKYIKNNNNLPYSLLFIPQGVTDIQKLIFDYVFIVNTILDKTKFIKTPSKFY